MQLEVFSKETDNEGFQNNQKTEKANFKEDLVVPLTKTPF